MGRSRYKIYEPTAPHFVTCTTVNWLPLFSSPPVADILFDSLAFLQEHARLSIYAYVIMENHAHLLVSSPDLAKEVGDFKSFTARKIIDYLKERGSTRMLRLLNFYKLKHKKDRMYQVWQEDSHPELIIDDNMLTQKIEYIHYNPVKRRYVEMPEHWLYSSARNFAGLSTLLKTTPLEELLR